eukprot:7391733-Prymnesium_polylepis.2
MHAARLPPMSLPCTADTTGMSSEYSAQKPSYKLQRLAAEVASGSSSESRWNGFPPTQKCLPAPCRMTDRMVAPCRTTHATASATSAASSVESELKRFGS